ncbi:MAG: FAD/NAD(P)-binding protein [Dehalococcoidia bacterium]
MIENIYLPRLATIQSMRPETVDIITFRVTIDSLDGEGKFEYKSGQFAEVSLPGVGEAPISISSSPTRPGAIEFSIRRVGELTNALHELKPGDKIGVRGPFGNFFSLDEMEGRNLLIIGGGIGLAPLRSVILNVFDNRAKYGKIDIIYGARSPQDLVYTSEYEDWQRVDNTTLYLTVDRGDESWKGNVGLVPTFLREIHPSPENTTSITCGPPIMIKFVIEALNEMGFPGEQIVTTLERKMKCGVGKCGRCNIGSKYVCLDGPVFTLKQLKEMLSD